MERLLAQVKHRAFPANHHLTPVQAVLPPFAPQRTPFAPQHQPVVAFTTSGHCGFTGHVPAFIAMCVKAIGAELPLMQGIRPYVMMQVLCDGQLVHAERMKRGHLPVHAPLLPEMAAVLEQDRRKRGEHRPRRLTLGRCDRFPYTFYCMPLPGTGVHLPQRCGDLSLRLWLEMHDPLAFPPIFHLLTSDPMRDRHGRLRWVKHRQWTLAAAYGPLNLQYEFTPCGCGVRVTMCYAATGDVAEERVRSWYFDSSIPG